MIADEIVEKASGQTWEDFVKSRIYEPLGMTDTKAASSLLKENQELAMPHLYREQQPRATFEPNGAHSMWSSTQEMAAWVSMWANGGKFNGKQVMPPAAMNAMMTQHISMPVSGYKKSMGVHFSGYGLGWFLSDYANKTIVEHGGGMPGYISKVVVVPEEQLGFVVLTNDMNSVPSVLKMYVLDYFLKKENPTDWAANYLEYKAAGEKAEKEAEDARVSARVLKTKPSLDLEKYVGTYRDKMYGDAKVELVGKDLVFTMLPTKEMFTAKMEHWHFDTWKVVLKDKFLPPGYVTFSFDSNHKIEGFKIDLPNPDFHFYNLDFKRVE